jgi:hypothetical protein
MPRNFVTVNSINGFFNFFFERYKSTKQARVQYLNMS